MSGSIEEMKSQLFNMKMKCHEYEQRLQQVNLHGVTGESLQRINAELSERLDQAERDYAEKEEEMTSLKTLLVKSREAIEALQSSNLRLHERVQELGQLEKELDLSKKECEEQRKLALKGEEYLRQLEEVIKEREELRIQCKAADERITALENKEIEQQVTENLVTQLQAMLSAKDKQLVQLEEQIQDEIHSYKARESQVEAVHRETDAVMRRKHQETELLHEERARKLEQTIDMLRYQIRDLEEMQRQNSLDKEGMSERIESYRQEISDVRHQLAEKEASLASYSQRESQAIIKAKEAIVNEFTDKLEEESRKFREKEREYWSQIGKKQTDFENLVTKVNGQKEKFRVKEQSYKDAIVQLEQELESVKSKWKSSITAKRKSMKENVAGSGGSSKSKTPLSSSKTKKVLGSNNLNKVPSSASVVNSAALKRPSFR